MWGTRLVTICIQQVGTDNSWCIRVFTTLAWCILGTRVHICLQATGLSCICVCQKSRTFINTHTFLRLSYFRNASSLAKTHTQGVLSHYHASASLPYAQIRWCIFHIHVPRLTLIFSAEAFEQGELGGVVGHGELFQHGFDHLSHRVGAADVQGVYGATWKVKRLLTFDPSCPTSFHRDGPPQVHLHLDEACVHAARILQDRDRGKTQKNIQFYD